MLDALVGLGVSLPVLAAPMAGGPTSAELVAAAARAGSLGFIAGGYKTAYELAAQVRAAREQTDRFGVNLFAPNPVPVNLAEYTSYRDRLGPEADRRKVAIPEVPVEDDDLWHDKVDLLVSDPVPVVTFTFAIPERAAIDALRAAGSLLVQTVTSPDEASRAADAGLDALIVQGWAAGGHSGTLNPSKPPVRRSLAELVGRVRDRVQLPIIAAGGLDTRQRVSEVIAAGAEVAAVGTALLLATEAGTSTPYRAALARPDPGPTVLTRAFTGRPARAIPNAFVRAHHEHAPIGYPALHHLTSPLRRAAAAAHDPEGISLWAGENYRSTRPGPVSVILEELASDL